MSKEAMRLELEHAKRDERHLNHAETRYWCRMYRDIAEKAIEALAEQPAQQELIDQLRNPEKHFPGNFQTPKQANALLMTLCDDAAQALAEKPAQQEPFGYFKAEPFGWTDCAETDEGAVALYEHPPAQQEPVAWMQDSIELYVQDRPSAIYTIPLYTSQPAQRTWVGLTDDELADLWYKQSLDWMEFARAIEAKLKEKST